VSVILGINAYHGDAAACIVVDGELVAAAEEERFRRIKHWAGFPSESIKYCLREARARLSDVSMIAINSDPKAGRLDRLAFVVQNKPSLSYVFKQIRKRMRRAGIAGELTKHFPGDVFHGPIRRVEHHLAHLASAYYLSPWQKAVAVSVDGFGDFASAAWGLAEGNRIEIDQRVSFPHSLGIFYETLTQYLGFPNYGDEYKVMGLAPYGQPKYVEPLSRLIDLKPDGSYELNLDYFRHGSNEISSSWEGEAPTKPSHLFSTKLEDLLGPARGAEEPLEQRHRDMARSVQAVYENAFFNLLRAAYDKHRVDKLVLAGGCGFNSVANGKVTLQTPFKAVYVQSAAGDAGGAVGAALHAFYEAEPGAAPHPTLRHAYLGPSYDDSEISSLLEANRAGLDQQGLRVRRLSDADLVHETARAIADGLVVGWFQGRMEWGPRALGNRSILGDPRRADMKDILNRKIKRRESFRPFAPSVLREQVAEWFELDDDVPFMMKVFQIREEKRAQIPAVTHVDGSGRLQTVYRDTNRRYHDLISTFRELTGVPMVLNTSFNENEPVVCRPEEALACFLRTKMDLLALGNWCVQRV
jgi:carbamoyltransferase